MELDRTHTHRTTSATTTSELFLCFTSRLSSSSSMRLTSSKSIHSPGRSADRPPTAVSLSNSLSRRLRNNGSLKGGQSPMFPSTVGSSKKRGCNFDNPEPSSPKVTCIGQVRVKTKKQGKKMKMRACGRSSSRRQNGEASFRRIEQGSGASSSQSNQGLSSGVHHLQHSQSQSSSHIQQQQQQQNCLRQRNQKWVHFPVTICEALRTFGSEFSCFLPCRSSSPCFSATNGTSGNDGREKTHELHHNHYHHHHHHHQQGNGSHNSSPSCGAVFRWLVAFHEGEGKTRDIELVVGGGEDERLEEGRRSVVIDGECSRRRSIFDDMDFKDEMFGVKDEDDNGGDEGRTSICVPPKNALLLMRCRSDPMRMSALASKLWEAPAPTTNEDTEEEEEEEEEEHDDDTSSEEDDQREEEDQRVEEQSSPAEEVNAAYKLRLQEEKVAEVNVSEDECSRSKDDEELIEDWVLVDADCQVIKVQDLSINPVEGKEEVEEKMQKEGGGQSCNNKAEFCKEDGLVSNRQSIDYAISLPRLFESSETDHIEKMENDEAAAKSTSQSQSPSAEENQAALEGDVYDFGGNEVSSEPSSSSSVTTEEDEEDKSAERRSELANPQDRESEEDQKKQEEQSEERGSTANDSASGRNALPDCLLLMMCEPKLSMEVSKETWVCRTDFLRCLPDRQQQHRPHHHLNSKPKDQDHQQLVGDATNREKKKEEAADGGPNPNAATNPLPAAQRQNPLPAASKYPPGFQPPRSSCSFPLGGGGGGGGASMASMIEQKLVNAVAYEPFVLTRCKSEPMRSAAVKFGATPELACFWKNRKLEPHRPAATFGATGLGF